MADMQIYLARPGGDREGPFSFQEILQDLQEGKYRENDFWAWYDGLPEWMPLHEVLKSPEVMQPAATAPISIAEPNAGAPIYTENDAPPAQPDSVSHSWAAPAVEGDFEFSEQSSEIPKLRKSKILLRSLCSLRQLPNRKSSRPRCLRLQCKCKPSQSLTSA